jgi:hypothetical protein
MMSSPHHHRQSHSVVHSIRKDCKRLEDYNNKHNHLKNIVVVSGFISKIKGAAFRSERKSSISKIITEEEMLDLISAYSKIR